MFPRNPIDVDRGTWFYIEPKGMCIVRQIRTKEGEYYHGDLFYLPWKHVLKAVKTYRKRKPRK